jgi:copper chaperone CopZ
MWLFPTLPILLATAVGAAVLVCPLCETATANGAAPGVIVETQSADTATVRLHISRMTCGSCPTTARLALKKLTGVYGATVTLDDSLGVVRYDPRKVSPAQIAAHLTRLTGFGATVLPDTAKTSKRAGGA